MPTAFGEGARNPFAFGGLDGVPGTGGLDLLARTRGELADGGGFPAERDRDVSATSKMSWRRKAARSSGERRSIASISVTVMSSAIVSSGSTAPISGSGNQGPT